MFFFLEDVGNFAGTAHFEEEAIGRKCFYGSECFGGVDFAEGAEEEVECFHGGELFGVGDDDLDTLADGIFPWAPVGTDPGLVKVDACEFCFVEVGGEPFGIHPGGCDYLKREGVSDANIEEGGEGAQDTCCGVEEGGHVGGYMGAWRHPHEASVLKMHGAFPSFHGDDVEGASGVVFFVEEECQLAYGHAVAVGYVDIADEGA